MSRKIHLLEKLWTWRNRDPWSPRTTIASQLTLIPRKTWSYRLKTTLPQARLRHCLKMKQPRSCLTATTEVWRKSLKMSRPRKRTCARLSNESSCGTTRAICSLQLFRRSYKLLRSSRQAEEYHCKQGSWKVGNPSRPKPWKAFQMRRKSLIARRVWLRSSTMPWRGLKFSLKAKVWTNCTTSLKFCRTRAIKTSTARFT